MNSVVLIIYAVGVLLANIAMTRLKPKLPLPMSIGLCILGSWITAAISYIIYLINKKES